jgi:hypothetical protein
LFNYFSYLSEKIPQSSSYSRNSSQNNATTLPIIYQTSILLEWCRKSLGCVAVDPKILHEGVVHLVAHYILRAECLVRQTGSGEDNVAGDGHWSMVALGDGVVEVRALMEAETYVAEDELVGNIDKAKGASC